MGLTTNSTASTLTSSTTSAEAVIPGEPVQPFTPEALRDPELQSFMKDVNAMLQRFSRLNQLSLVDDTEFDAKVKKMESEMGLDGSGPSSWVLLDSGPPTLTVLPLKVRNNRRFPLKCNSLMGRRFYYDKIERELCCPTTRSRRQRRETTRSLCPWAAWYKSWAARLIGPGVVWKLFILLTV